MEMMYSSMINDKPLFSVCVLTYKNIDRLEKTIKSISMQNYGVMELVISDDCTYDDCAKSYNKISEIVQPYQSKFIRTIISINEKRLGTVKNLNLAMQHLRGEYWCFLGSGDGFYSPNALEDALENMIQNGTMLCASKILAQKRNGRNMILPRRRIIKAYDDMKKLLRLCFREINYIVTIGMFFNKRLFDKYGKYDESYYLLEDAPYYMELLLKGERISFLDKVTCFYDYGGVSDPHKKKNLLLEKDSIRTLTDVKYPSRYRVDAFSRRIVEYKYRVRTTDNVWKKIKASLVYPDAASYLLGYLAVTKILR